jgi:hypothetical protein
LSGVAANIEFLALTIWCVAPFASPPSTALELDARNRFARNRWLRGRPMLKQKTGA